MTYVMTSEASRAVIPYNWFSKCLRFDTRFWIYGAKPSGGPWHFVVSDHWLQPWFAFFQDSTLYWHVDIVDWNLLSWASCTVKETLQGGREDNSQRVVAIPSLHFCVVDGPLCCRWSSCLLRKSTTTSLFLSHSVPCYLCCTSPPEIKFDFCTLFHHSWWSNPLL